MSKRQQKKQAVYAVARSQELLETSFGVYWILSFHAMNASFFESNCFDKQFSLLLLLHRPLLLCPVRFRPWPGLNLLGVGAGRARSGRARSNEAHPNR